MLVDGEIIKIGEKLISPFKEENVQAVGYDLTSHVYWTADGVELDHIELGPMQSVFVQCKETIALPDNMTAQVFLRNSRIRQGLLLTAPLYQPGHKTPVYFRVTNVGGHVVPLKSGDGLAILIFEALGASVDRPYQGTFQNEGKYRGMGDYAELYASQGDVREGAEKTEDL